MPLKIVRNDITKMETEAIVNTANDKPTVGTGCDSAIYKAAGYDQLLAYRTEKIGAVPEGEVFITPGYQLKAKYIIHAVSPFYLDGHSGEEEKLRSCYRKSLEMASVCGIKSISFPLISTGGFGYPKEEGFRIAIAEIYAFLMHHDMLVYLVVFDGKATRLGSSIYPDLESYIDRNYVQEKRKEEYDIFENGAANGTELHSTDARRESTKRDTIRRMFMEEEPAVPASTPQTEAPASAAAEDTSEDFYEKHESALKERMKHMTDTFAEYLIYLIDSRGMTYPEVYKRAIVDKKVFSKIKNNPDAHPKKMTAMCLCVGAKLNLDETRDLLARAGYALSPCDHTDIIFSYFIENQIYDMIELDIQLEAHGLPCLIS